MEFRKLESSRVKLAVRVAIVAVFIGLAFYRLADYPTTWFDEGIHLHVPETLVRYGVYADRSSDGFRYFGPTLGVGPTVMLPIAAAFKLFGVGLLQARAVMALYLLAAFYVFYRFARSLHGSTFALFALALLMTAPSVAMVQTGRQVLGEVPAFLMLVGGFWLWFSAWDGSFVRLTAAGLLFGAAAVTKYQNLIVLAPTIAMAGLLDLLYYRAARLRVFIWPGVLLAAVFGLWQVVLVVYLGPQTSAENFATLREASAGAAAVFSSEAMRRAVRELLSFNTYGGSLLLALPYAVVCSLQRTRRDQQWGILVLFTLLNLAWFALASIGWLRYAFAGLAFSSLFVAKFVLDLWDVVTDRVRRAEPAAGAGMRRAAFQAAIAVWVAAIVAPGLYSMAKPILRPPENAPVEMAAYLTRDIPTTSIVETWEPELGALTDHNYHYPPARLLPVAVRHIWFGGPAPSLQYRPLETDRPPYVVVGAFARWVDAYPQQLLEKNYSMMKKIGGYEVYRRNDLVSEMRGTP